MKCIYLLLIFISITYHLSHAQIQIDSIKLECKCYDGTPIVLMDYLAKISEYQRDSLLSLIVSQESVKTNTRCEDLNSKTAFYIYEYSKTKPLREKVINYFMDRKDVGKTCHFPYKILFATLLCKFPTYISISRRDSLLFDMFGPHLNIQQPSILYMFDISEDPRIWAVIKNRASYFDTNDERGFLLIENILLARRGDEEAMDRIIKYIKIFREDYCYVVYGLSNLIRELSCKKFFIKFFDMFIEEENKTCYDKESDTTYNSLHILYSYLPLCASELRIYKDPDELIADKASINQWIQTNMDSIKINPPIELKCNPNL